MTWEFVFVALGFMGLVAYALNLFAGKNSGLNKEETNDKKEEK